MASRLIDKLLVNPYLDRYIREALSKSYVVSADNVVRYLESENTGEVPEGKRWADLPRIVPPFNFTFIQTVDPYRPQDERGFLISRDKTVDGWVLTFFVVGSYVAKVPRWGAFEVVLNKEGYFVDTTDGQFDVHANPDFIVVNNLGQQAQKELASVITGSALWAAWTLAFMNTKNIIMEAVEPNASENKRRAKHGKLPLMRYHVLKIKPMGREAGHDQGGTHASPALHIRRGHFKTYTDAAPLFGKLVGTFWVDQHIAGKKSNRVVVKDYEVLAPEPA